MSALDGEPRPNRSLETVMAWLEAKHVGLWADWSVVDPSQRERAARWFLDQIADLEHWANTP